MTIPSNVTRNSYTGTGITGPYPVTFKFFENADLKVTVADTNGVETVKTLTSDYTVTGAGEQAGGSITFTTAVTNGYSIVIEPKADLTQDTDIKNEGGNLRESIEDRFDRLCRDDQVQQNLIDRSVKVQITDVSVADPVLPPREAGALIGWNDSGTGFANRSASLLAQDAPVTATGSTSARWLSDRFAEVTNVRDFGAIGDGVSDDTAAIQAAITKAAGRSIYFPPGVYITSGTITLSKNTKYIGSGKSIDVSKGSVIKYTGAGDAFADLNPIDTPTAANITIQDISFYYVTPTVAQKKCAIHLRGSTFVAFVNCGFYGGEYGVIADQAELVSFTRCDFESQSTGCLWLTNGADKTPTASEAFTNRITVSECQFNTASAIGVVDDGGLAHVYENNNFNACSTHIRLCGVEACVISGNELEVATSDSILTSATKYGGGSPAVSKCRGLNIVGNFIFQSAGGTGAINFAAASVETAIVTGNDVNTPAGVAVVAGAANAVSLTMFANFQRGAGTAANNYYEEGQWSPVVKFGGASVGIAGSFVGKYTKIGRIVYWNCTLAFTNKGSSVGDMTVAGLPYSAGTVATFPGSPGIVTNLAGATVVQPWVNESANVVTMQKGNLASTSNMADTDIQNNTRIDVAGWYIAA